MGQAPMSSPVNVWECPGEVAYYGLEWSAVHFKVAYGVNCWIKGYFEMFTYIKGYICFLTEQIEIPSDHLQKLP